MPHTIQYTTQIHMCNSYDNFWFKFESSSSFESLLCSYNQGCSLANMHCNKHTSVKILQNWLVNSHFLSNLSACWQRGLFPLLSSPSQTTYTQDPATKKAACNTTEAFSTSTACLWCTLAGHFVYHHSYISINYILHFFEGKSCQ